VASALMWVRPAGCGVWVGPMVGAAVAVLFGLVAWGDATDAIEGVASPLLFLVFAVPLAVALDELGVFGALAALIGNSRHLIAGLWWLAAGVVILFNLDAAVVLLTPLYIRIARRHGRNVEALAVQPALLACLASGVLPVSNLTNLIVAEQHDLDVADFLMHLALPSAIATGVGFIAYRSVFANGGASVSAEDPADTRALRRGLPIVAFVLVGFTVGESLRVDAWMVAAVALVWAVTWTRRITWRTLPFDAILTTAGLVVLVAAAAPHLALDRWFAIEGVFGSLRSTVAATILSNLTNNLPVALAASGSIIEADQSWPLLVGTNVGSIFVVTASLSTLLWRETAARSDLHISATRWTSIAARIGLPALVAATATMLVIEHVVGSPS